MKDALSGVGPLVDDEPIAARKTEGHGDLFRGEQQVTERDRVAGLHGVDAGNVLARNHQHVNRRHGTDIPKCNDVVILEENR